MKQQLTIVMAQLNFMLGDITQNCEKIIAAAQHCRDDLQADIAVFPELAMTGYPPEDLLLRAEFNRRSQAALDTICQQVHDIYLVIGHPQQTSSGLFNAASLLYNGDIVNTYHKYHLPNYSVFDEKRYFKRHKTPHPLIFTVKNTPIAITICEDIWRPGPFSQAIEGGAQLMLCINASPFHFKKPGARVQTLRQRQIEEGAIPIVYVNCVGGQDELVFDGSSMVIDGQGQVCQAAPLFKESFERVTVEINDKLSIVQQTLPPELSLEETLYRALVLGTRDYIKKNGFEGAIIGLSGGIDSALTLAIAVDAIGAAHIHAVLMPSRYTSQMSTEDAKQMADNVGVNYDTISIEPQFDAFLSSLEPIFAGLPADTTEENIQARCRCILLMALSNKSGHVVLTTGNKSEFAVGYTTLYGDMAGGFAVIKDLPKTMVYRLANYRNQIKPVIPQRIIDRPPSAELAANQTDQDSLPPYEVLDRIIAAYVEENLSIKKIVSQENIDEEVVTQVVSLIERNEYKRRQSPPGVRLTPRAFGRDWRYPITSGFQRACKVKNKSDS